MANGWQSNITGDPNQPDPLQSPGGGGWQANVDPTEQAPNFLTLRTLTDPRGPVPPGVQTQVQQIARIQQPQSTSYATSVNPSGWSLPWNRNSFYGNLADIESGNRNIPSETDPGGPNEVSQGYFQINTDTWHDFAPKAGVDIQKFPRAMMADPATQQAVVNNIPFSRFGPRTQRMLIAKYGQIDPSMTIGELASKFGDGTTSGYTVLGQGGVSPGNALTLHPGTAVAGNALGGQGQGTRPTVNPLSLPEPMDMRKMMGLAMLRSVLGSGMGFQRVAYDPRDVTRVREYLDRSKVGTGAGLMTGLPRLFGGATQVGSQPAKAAYSPFSQPGAQRQSGGAPKQPAGE